ncbi:hypothetical protein C2W62_26980 [Candidatus Entotheonella serta]|nr:hypothetical protein C2W62_26980 [Candidatus Entotheonella serta]
MNLSDALTYHYRAVSRDIICAPDAIGELGDALDQVMAYKAMIICGPTILQHANVVQRVQAALGERCAGVYAGVLPHAPVAMMAEALQAAQPEALVSIGGGSSHDTAKGLATLLAQGGRIHDYETRFTPPDQVELQNFTNNKIPVIAVSTTMGAAELSGGAGFTDHDLGRKIVVADPWTVPRSVLIDGQALATTPLSILRSTAIGQFRIAVESICSPRHNPIGDAMGTAAIRMLVAAFAHVFSGRYRRSLAGKNSCLYGLAGQCRGAGIVHRYGSPCGWLIQRGAR